MTYPYYSVLPQMSPPVWDCTPTPIRAMTEPKDDPIPEGEDEGSSPVPPEEGAPQTITITEPTIIVPNDDDSEGDSA